MDERAARVHAHRDWLRAHNHKMRLIERHRSQTFEGLTVSKFHEDVQQSIGALLADGAKPSCQSRPSSSGTCRDAISPTGRASCSAQTPTTSTQKSRSSENGPMPQPQTPASSRSMVVAAARTKPVKKPIAKRALARKQQRKIERLLSKGADVDPGGNGLQSAKCTWQLLGS